MKTIKEGILKMVGEKVLCVKDYEEKPNESIEQVSVKDYEEKLNESIEQNE